jgi:hypothetical protein
VCWQIVINEEMGFKHQVTPTPRFHKLNNWCYQTVWLFSGAPDNPEDDTVMGKHGAETLYSALKSLMHAVRTEDKEAQQDAAHWMIQNAK